MIATEPSSAFSTITESTTHRVDEEYDHGTIHGQCEVPVLPDDTPDTLGARVREREHALYVDTPRRVSAGEIFRFGS